MKNLKLLIAAIGLLSITACQKSDDDLNNTSTQTPQLHALGANFVDQNTYDSFQKVDVNELTLKYKGKDETTAKAALPTAYSIPTTAPIKNQGAEGSCVAWSTAYAATSALEFNYKGVISPRSPEYVFNQIKSNPNDCSQGSLIPDALNLIQNQGVCSWDEMPYTDTGCSTQPNPTQQNAASTHKFTNWAIVDKTNLGNVKTLLSMNLPIIIAVNVDASFDNLSAANGWVWKSHSGAVRGGHAICVIGYDDAKQAFKVQNSWGTGWGQNGYFWISYSFFTRNFNGAVRESYVAYVQ
ncbi:C1 family peptidase [Chryseobacterium sp. IT-36CA2]|uniref:C1 family peptidase n=1 Tax=Chryseobacterium sp. IT-36CA2 TaxID=3026460 RepID=UPI0039DFE4B8